MTDRSYLESLTGVSHQEFKDLPRDRRSALIRESVPDLHAFLDEGDDFNTRLAPELSRAMARSLHGALVEAIEAAGTEIPANLTRRLITNDLLRTEADRDQNVYLWPFFTRTLTNAVPDLIFQPESFLEAVTALDWAARTEIPVTLRGAASAAMGGSVPHDGGLTLDASRLDEIDPQPGENCCVVGAGARLRDVHRVLAERGLALPVYPSNLGGTFAGWFATGGIGMNAFASGRALDIVQSADVVLPGGQHVRFHVGGRLDVFENNEPRALDPNEATEWFRKRGHEPLALTDIAGSEGVFGLILRLTLRVENRPRMAAFLLAFESRADAVATINLLYERVAAGALSKPANLKLLSDSHMSHVRTVWRDEDARAWKSRPSALTSGAMQPWASMVSPDEGYATADATDGGAYLFVDFADVADARRFAAGVSELPGGPVWNVVESRRFAIERFKPQQSKRLGPGLLAAEIVIPTPEVGRYLEEMERVAGNAGIDPDAEVYFLSDGTALVIAAYLTDHRKGRFLFELLAGPTLLDLAMRHHGGRPYVLGRWQAGFTKQHFGAARAAALRQIKAVLDPNTLVNRGVLFGLRMRGLLGSLMNATFAPMVRLARRLYMLPYISWFASAKNPILDLFPGPAAGRGEVAAVGARFRTKSSGPEPRAPGSPPDAAVTMQQASARALHCVNCGECNSVCPIFADSKIRLPQMLTHIGEGVYAGDGVSEDAKTLLDLCMRCGNCEEVCQAGIPHLPLYEIMEARARVPGASREPNEKHVAILAAVRGSGRYMSDFLQLRPGAYEKRAPAALPQVPGYILMRSQGDAGPAATCIHCSACVPVCPTEANFEFKGEDARWITTDQSRCIGCGTCVEICPANLLNGGQTLRVVEAPTLSWFEALDEFEREEAPRA